MALLQKRRKAVKWTVDEQRKKNTVVWPSAPSIKSGFLRCSRRKLTLKIDKSGNSTLSGTNPLQKYPDNRKVLEMQLSTLVNNEHAGDLVLFGATTEEGRVIDLEDVYDLGVGSQFGAHGGLGGAQTVPFIISPKNAMIDTEAVLNSSDLFYQFVRNSQNSDNT